ncbi:MULTISPECIES: hypothetical protein [Paenibacillus]|uniref:Uncharacterized protein n=2 Tax=Paenibacillus TaxID=44249 RepID=A0ABX2ZEL9_PAEPO|nr:MULTISPECIES: hypothetical protein [Paenibacillus]ALA44524.1 hypothetical protein ABE82_24880 [Paenibacillus peoriae]MCP3745547.1 hypothetical protein [Paenibacillus sp. A3M_27_13]MDQ0048592.1 hypothetical protein [Paenibacillus polymyxa]MDR6778527.1 hypothetical protein [Paenibacillus peoriae]MDY8022316.1 hypothetical protein [Paenibacillus polymyxa]
MKKRVLLGTLALTFMFSASAFATEVSEKDSESVKSYSYTNEDNFIVKVQEKTFTPLSDGSGITLAASPDWTCSTKLGKAFKFPVPQAQLFSTGETRSSFVASKLGVVTRLYHNGGILATASDTQSNTNLAAATAWQGTMILPSYDAYGYSNHSFESKGYSSWYPETREDYNGW